MKTGGCGCVARPRAPAAVEVIADRAGLDRALAELEARRDDAVRAVLGLPAKPQRRSRAASKRWRAALPSRLRTRGRRGPAPVKEMGAEAKEAWQDQDVARCGSNGVVAALRERQQDERKAHLPQNEVPQGGPKQNNPGDVTDWRYQPSERFAINNPYLYLSEDRGGSHRKYGTMEDILQDIEDLGAGVIRQPHRLQLFLERFVPDGFSVSLSGPGRVDAERAEAAIAASVRTSDLLGPSGRLEDVVRHLHDTGSSLKLLLTFLTLGGGREALDLTYDVYSNPLGYPWSPAAHAGRSMSVWMRLSVALAGGADIVGWHTFMSDNGLIGAGEESQFAAMGLRRDQHDRDVAPSAAQQRVSWFAYQRMTRLLGSVVSTTILLPEPSRVGSDHSDLEELIATDWDLLDDVWCIELELNSPFLARWAYVLFLDPYGEANCAEIYLRSASASRGTAIRVVQMPTNPLEFSSGPTVAREFPEDSWTVEEAIEVALELAELLVVRVDLARGTWPVLLLATEALTPFRLYTSETAP